MFELVPVRKALFSQIPGDVLVDLSNIFCSRNPRAFRTDESSKFSNARFFYLYQAVGNFTKSPFSWILGYKTLCCL